MTVKETIKLSEGGVIESAEITTLKKVKAEEFCQIYLRNNDDFYNLSKAESNVLAVCWLHSIYYEDPEFNCPGNKVTFDGQFKQVVKDKTKLSDGTIKNTMKSLVNKRMLIKDQKFRGVYYLNPNYFFKGRISERTKLITKVINYQIDQNG